MVQLQHTNKQRAVSLGKCFEKGLLWTHQLYNNGTLISAYQAYEKYTLTWMEFNSLVSAIPKEMKKKLREKQAQHGNDNCGDLDLKKGLCNPH